MDCHKDHRLGIVSTYYLDMALEGMCLSSNWFQEKGQ